MRSRYGNGLREAMVCLKEAKLPNVSVVIIPVLICIAAYIVLAIVILPEGRERAYHFVSEDGAITALSALILAMASAFSVGSLVVRIRAKDPQIWPWVVMAAGFAVFGTRIDKAPTQLSFVA